MSYQTRQAEEYAAAPRTRFNPQNVNIIGGAVEITDELPRKADLGASPTFDLVVGDYPAPAGGNANPGQGVFLTDETGGTANVLATFAMRPDLPYYGSIVVPGLFPRVEDAGGAGVDCLVSPSGQKYRVFILAQVGAAARYFVSEIPRLDFPWRAEPRRPFPWPTPQMQRRTHLACEYAAAACWYTKAVYPEVEGEGSLEITALVPDADEIGRETPWVTLLLAQQQNTDAFMMGVAFGDDASAPTYFPRQDQNLAPAVLMNHGVWKMLPRIPGGDTLIDGTRVWLRNFNPDPPDAVALQFAVPSLASR